MKRIPITAAERIARDFGYDQVIIVARKVGEGEHLTTYGRTKEHCRIAARVGEFLRDEIMGWHRAEETK